MLGVKQDMHMSAWKKTLIAGLFPGMNIEFSYEMKENQNMLVNTKAKVGVFSIALGAYLPQFPELVPEFRGQYEAFKKTLPGTVELVDGGFVTTKEESQAAGEKFRAADVDLVILQLLTYATSYNMLPAVKDLDVPVILVNGQSARWRPISIATASVMPSSRAWSRAATPRCSARLRIGAVRRDGRYGLGYGKVCGRIRAVGTGGTARSGRVPL